MKTKKCILRVTLTSLSVMLLVAVIFSCRKHDEGVTYTPLNPDPDPTPRFAYRPLHLMSDYEVNNQYTFPGHLLHKLGKKLHPGVSKPVGKIKSTNVGPFEIFSFVAELCWKIYDFEKTEAEFREIKNDIHNIQAQIGELEVQVNELGLQLSLDVSELESFMQSQEISQWITLIREVMDSTNHNGLTYYAAMGREYQEGRIDENRMKMVRQEDSIFACDVYYNHGVNVETYISELNTLLCPPLGAKSNNALQTFATVLIKKANGLNLQDSSSILKYYMLLENYFLQVVNYQYQAAVVLMNAKNFHDTTGYQATLWYTGSFQNKIVQELKEFLNCVDYFALNIGDHRTQARYQSDMVFADKGLAPDNLFIHVLARAQFLNNLLLSTFNLHVPPVCGRIIVPHYNIVGTNGPSSIDSFALTVGNRTMTSTALSTQVQQGTGMASQFPYPVFYYQIIPLPFFYCTPDNHWNVFRFGKNTGADTVAWSSSPQQINIIDNGNNHWPWTHFSTSLGSVTPLYYNPENPGQTSPIATSQCTMPFAFFSANWKWGSMAIHNSPAPSVNTPINMEYFPPAVGNIYIKNYSDGNEVPPMVGDYNWYYSKQGWHEWPGWNSYFTHQNGIFGNMDFTCNMPANQVYTLIIDMVLFDFLSIANQLPEFNGSVETWLDYAYSFNAPPAYAPSIDIMIGTSAEFDQFNGQSCFRSFHNLLNVSKDQSNGVQHHAFTTATLTPNGSLNFPHVLYGFNMYNNPNNTPVTISVHTKMQVVYKGLYDLD